jgi:hypothetical protein
VIQRPSAGGVSNTVWDVNVRVLAVGRHDVEKIT